MKIKIIVFFVLVIFLVLTFLIFYPRKPLILDDVTPAKSCDKLVEKADIIYIIPFHRNTTLNPEWCKEMSSLNKTFGLHGITHVYHEFLKPIKKTEFQKAIDAFEECFGYRPTLFRPPFNRISEENKQLIKEFNLTLYKKTYIRHPYCHCEPVYWVEPFNWPVGC